MPAFGIQSRSAGQDMNKGLLSTLSAALQLPLAYGSNLSDLD